MLLLMVLLAVRYGMLHATVEFFGHVHDIFMIWCMLLLSFLGMYKVLLFRGFNMCLMFKIIFVGIEGPISQFDI